jgi:quinoprotein glucose dehydrogenase
VRWEVPLGSSAGTLDTVRSARLGSLNFGGSLTTAGGLVFIGAGRDTTLRVFDFETGQVLGAYVVANGV